MIIMKDIFLKEVMVTQPVTLPVKSPFSKVEEMFRQYHIRHIAIIDERGIIQGIISQRDLYRITSPKTNLEGDVVYDSQELNQFILEHVMTRDPFCMRPEDTLGEVIEVMVDKRYGCIPIVDINRRLVGIITQIDVLKAVARYYKDGFWEFPGHIT